MTGTRDSVEWVIGWGSGAPEGPENTTESRVVRIGVVALQQAGKAGSRLFQTRKGERDRSSHHLLSIPRSAEDLGHSRVRRRLFRRRSAGH